MAEYVVPQCGLISGIGTDGHSSMAKVSLLWKASADTGGMLDQIKYAAKNPGPDAYHKDALARPFTAGALGGTFSRLTREHAGFVPKPTKGPSVGQYEIAAAKQMTTPRTRGGIVSKNTRGSILYDRAMKEAKWKQGPGKYEVKMPESHLATPNINSSKGIKEHQGGTTLGPGYYNLNHIHTEKKVISHTAPKEASRSLLDKTLKDKEKSPAPGHHGVPDSRVEDREGRRKHCAKLLGDRIVTPRRMPPSSRSAGPDADACSATW